jgi:hypothetical protein
MAAMAYSRWPSREPVQPEPKRPQTVREPAPPKPAPNRSRYDRHGRKAACTFQNILDGKAKASVDQLSAMLNEPDLDNRARDLITVLNREKVAAKANEENHETKMTL